MKHTYTMSNQESSWNSFFNVIRKIPTNKIKYNYIYTFPFIKEKKKKKKPVIPTAEFCHCFISTNCFSYNI